MSNRFVKKGAYDERWYPTLLRWGSFSLYEYLNEALSGSGGRLRRFNLKEREDRLKKLAAEIAGKETDRDVRAAYLSCLEEKILQLRLLRAVRRGEDHSVYQISVKLYGRPNSSAVKLTKEELAERLFVFEADGTMPAAARRAAAGLIERFSLSVPRNFSLSGKSRQVAKKRGRLLAPVELKKFMESKLARKSLRDWRVVLSSRALSVNVNHAKRSIVIPKDREISVLKAEALAVHEIDTHIMRRVNGERSKLSLLGFGLNAYERGEEGVAAWREREVLGLKSVPGFSGMLSVVLVTGALDGRRRDYKELFDFWFNYNIASGKNVAMAEKLAEKRCCRVFRGTSGQTPGACFVKDKIYREGYLSIKRLLKKNPREEKRFSAGKYDPSNEFHRLLMDKFAIESQ